MKKIFLAILAIFLIVVGASAVSAFDLDFLGASEENTTITLDGVDFNIPDGFVEDTKYEIVNESATSGVDYTMNGKSFEKGSDFIAILVSNYGDLEVTDEIIASLGGNKTTLNGVDGYLNFDGEFYTFSYPVDGKLAVLSSDNPDIFEEFIVA